MTKSKRMKLRFHKTSNCKSRHLKQVNIDELIMVRYKIFEVV